MTSPEGREPAKSEAVDGGFVVTFPSIVSDGKPLKVSVLTDALDDLELLDDMDQFERGRAQRLPSILRRLTGGDYERILEALRGDSGRVRMSDAGLFLRDLFGAINPKS